MEEWRDVKDYEGLYQVSNLGNVKSVSHIIKANKDGGTRITNEQFKKIHIGWHGYCWVSLSKNGKAKTFSIHRLVALAFIPNPNNLSSVNHIDGNKQNNCISNLEWCSNAYNSEHAKRTGLIKGRAVRCVEKNMIFRSSNEAEKQMGINSRTIRNVCSGKGRTAGGFRWEYVE